MKTTKKKETPVIVTVEEPLKATEDRAATRVQETDGIIQELTPAQKQTMISRLSTLALEELKGQVMATKRYWSAKKEDWIVEPDFPVRQRAIETVLNYDIGRPIERRVDLQVKAETLSDKMLLAKQSPEALRILLAARMIPQEEFDRCMDLLDSPQKALNVKSLMNSASVDGVQKDA